MKLHTTLCLLLFLACGCSSVMDTAALLAGGERIEMEDGRSAWILDESQESTGGLGDAIWGLAGLPAVPALFRRGRKAYGKAIRAALGGSGRAAHVKENFDRLNALEGRLALLEPPDGAKSTTLDPATTLEA